MKRLGLLWLAALYVAALLWGVTGVAVALVVCPVLFFVAFPERFITTDPHNSTSALDHRDGVGVQR